ncbi:uncharacterized protein LY89DRAFT_80044 [Mollisia scopiformis]|uniref:Uncharacterized protein n=1 Tax=Mollisia scopiformis TaxID=149040 RepID=A0A194X834_MOLSC|nr:uncharacterized protein LY89DRAFT_80044 [Mollisia scopiformis]KUJ16326.1 hypothetical protein LY89DRAFT_80044 [Mollisia scopiformis]
MVLCSRTRMVVEVNLEAEGNWTLGGRWRGSLSASSDLSCHEEHVRWSWMWRWSGVC